MATRNGPIRAGDLTPEIIDAVEILRDGQPIVLRGYVMGTRCPGRVKAAAIAAMRDNPQPDGSFSFGVHMAQIRDMLCAVVLGITDEEADILAGDDSDVGALAVLMRLGFWASNDADSLDDTDPEVTAVSSTTENSSPSSRRSTASARRNS